MKYNETYFAELVASQRKYPEIFGKVEYPCNYKGKRMRIDITTDDHAYECKFGANSWKAAIGQALSYAMMVDKKAGIIVFIRTDPKFQDKDIKGYEIMMKTIKEHKLPIDTRRFYVNRVSGKISKKNELIWENDKKLSETVNKIENENKVHKSIFSIFKR